MRGLISNNLVEFDEALDFVGIIQESRSRRVAFLLIASTLRGRSSVNANIDSNYKVAHGKAFRPLDYSAQPNPT